ncbi:helix-turn-helix domain-containing protein [Paenibacillus tyrfis]|uniref:helix-turn-helix domain-containing protein n=1 Tax=Paenibacillus tyrfis TaxID=1501230 RepID=UPI000B59624F|nr:helix-turn-helix domain-containing protein [Paenibacillus tyrfis]
MMDAKHYDKTISDFIFLFRTEGNLTYAELEKLTGVSIPVLHKIESRVTKHPEYRTVKALAHAFPTLYKDIIMAYVKQEERIENLFKILNEVVTSTENFSLIPIVATRILQSPLKKTEHSLQRLYDFTESINNDSAKVSLYKIIVQYSRDHGIPIFVAKGLFQKYLIERTDLSKMKEAFREGEEILHYIDFLSLEERVTYYYRMSLLAYTLKKYDKCVKFGHTGHVKDRTSSELKERVALAICNSFWHQGDYKALEEHIALYEKLNYQIIIDRLKIFRAMILARTGRYMESLPLLWECLDEVQGVQRLPRLNLLLEVLLKINDDESIERLINSNEDRFFPFENATPYQYSEIGKYYKFKGAFFIRKGLVDQATDTFSFFMTHQNFLVNDTTNGQSLC